MESFDGNNNEIQQLYELFSRPTADWFSSSFESPTKVQSEAWPAIKSGKDVLVSAPTGTGKTLTAFLVFIDELKNRSGQHPRTSSVSLIYVSPLKSLANDVDANIIKPIAEIPGNFVSTFVRTGDTPQKDRAKMLRNPPDILVTTPESLYLMLTSKHAKNVLSTAKAVIIDEIHAVINEKRGAHLMLSLARLDAICPAPLQRIGLSATIAPLDLVSSYLSPQRGAVVVCPFIEKKKKITVKSVSPEQFAPMGSLWSTIASEVASLCEGRRTVIAFTPSRAQAERLAYNVNALAGEAFAMTHHGCVSKEQRLLAEERLRSGALRLLCATSSMELGIDVGEVDLVIQLGPPKSMSSALQRLGRAGHSPQRTSEMVMLARDPVECLYCSMSAQLALSGFIEMANPPMLCYDVLAQHLVSMACYGSYTLDEALRAANSAYNFAGITMDEIKKICFMLAAGYEHSLDTPAKPRFRYDSYRGIVEGDSYTSMLALSSPGTIPDKGAYAVKLENGARVGELDEEFVFEAKSGDKFMLGSNAWQIKKITASDVLVAPTSTEGAQSPFWRGEGQSRDYATGLAYGEILAQAANGQQKNLFPQASETAAKQAESLLASQFYHTGAIPTGGQIVIEHYLDEHGKNQAAIHSVFGKKTNAPLAELIKHIAKTQRGIELRSFENDDGILLYSMGGDQVPWHLVQDASNSPFEEILTALLPATQLFSMAFRYNLGRSLMFGVRRAGRQPLWIQRLKSATMLGNSVVYESHPLVEETIRECLHSYWDIHSLADILRNVTNGAIKILEAQAPAPSPMGAPLRKQLETEMLYEYSPLSPKTSSTITQRLGKIGVGSLASPGVIASSYPSVGNIATATSLKSLLMEQGDISQTGISHELFEELEFYGSAIYMNPGFWIAAERLGEYKLALEELDEGSIDTICRRAMRYQGPQEAGSLSMRYMLPLRACEDSIARLAKIGSIIQGPDGKYVHADIFESAQKKALAEARKNSSTIFPASRFAALLAANTPSSAASQDDSMEAALKSVYGASFPLQAWEEALFPSRVAGYSPRILDSAIASGQWVYSIRDGQISFYPYNAIDWEAEPSYKSMDLTQEERRLAEVIEKRGSMAESNIASLGNGARKTLLSLAQKGSVRSDSLFFARNMPKLTKLDSLAVKSRAKLSSQSLAMSGRWELDRPFTRSGAQEAVQASFDSNILLCRSTIIGASWEETREALELMEFSGTARRGYFVEGLPGEQYIRSEEYSQTIEKLSNPPSKPQWLCALDPSLAWGLVLAHEEGREFARLASSAVCLIEGRVAAVCEKKGKSIEIFDNVSTSIIIKTLLEEFAARRIFASSSKLVVSKYPASAAPVFEELGFVRLMGDYAYYLK
ncbi:MAG: DEAD/DEAH box helicase [Eubacteriaceae bacterium]|nr:DEAD/DEAH box helicase [Eubacteriaceae bacterium]